MRKALSRILRILHRPENYQLQTVNFKEGGYFLVTTIIIALFLTTIGLAVAALSTAQYQHTTREVYVQNAELLAEAGIEQTVRQLNTDDAFSGYTSDQEFFNNSSQGRGTFTTTVTNNTGENSKTIVAEGRVYRNSGDTNPYITRKIEAIVVGTASEGHSVFSGPGGLILGGSANITNSDVYVNGFIDMNGASHIGTSSNPLDVNVAHQTCPTGSDPGPTYPETCTSGEPISMDWSTRIYGSVCATNQTSTGPNNNIQGGAGGQGLISGCTAPEVSQPPFNRTEHIDNMTTTHSGNWTCSWPFERSWPDNWRVNGDATVASSCDLTINGNVYITGDLTIGGAARIRAADSLGTTRPVVLVDGDIDVGGSAQMIANNQGTGIHFISWKSNAGCNPDCTDITGTELKNTQDLLTIDIGGASNLPGMVFQAYWGRVRLAGSGNMGSAVGQTVDLSGAGTVTFGTELSSGSRTWTISSYRPIYD